MAQATAQVATSPRHEDKEARGLWAEHGRRGKDSPMAHTADNRNRRAQPLTTPENTASAGSEPRPQGARRLGRVALAAALAAAVAGCSGFNVREELGIVGQGPDEFTVVKKKPLTMPGDMTALPTPDPGAPSLVDPRPTEQARAALTGAPIETNGQGGSAAESALLAAAGADRADPEVRRKLIEDEQGLDTRLLDTILPSIGPDENLLDPDAEARRLADDARAGKNPNLEPLPPRPE